MSVRLVDVAAAARRIEGAVRNTPLLRSETIDRICGGREIYFKAENVQRTGSFKARGALNAVKLLGAEAPGVVTHSSGNHGQALAWAARTCGLPCSVVVPHEAPTPKVEAIKGYGAAVTFCKPSERISTMEALADETGFVPVPPYDHLDVIAGQGTIGLEMMQQFPEKGLLDAVLVPVSGGGMVAGIAVAIKALSPDTRVICVEPAGKELGASLAAGKPLWPDNAPTLSTIADGMRTRPLGTLTWPLVSRLVDPHVITVSDDEIRSAMRLTMERMKVVVEPSGATALAAALRLDQEPGLDGLNRVGLIMCGGNLDLCQLGGGV